MLSLHHRRRLSAMLAQFLMLVFLGSIARAKTAGPGLFLLQMRGHFVLDFPNGYTAYTHAGFRTAVEHCAMHGGVPASDPNFGYTNAIAFHIKNYRNITGTSFYTGATAQPSNYATTFCHPAKAGTYNGSNCIFRWIFGFYDYYSYMKEPGTAFWEGIYRFDKNPEKAALNFYTQYNWNETSTYPYGDYFMINGYNATDGLLYRADCSERPHEKSANARENFLIACEVQSHPMDSPKVTKAAQPIFVKGWDEMTWAQKNWFLIYSAFLFVLLLIISLIAGYCCITSMTKSAGKPINSMVIREYRGFPFEVDNGSAVNAAHLQFPLNHWDPTPHVKPEDFNQRNPLVLEAPDVNQYSNANSYGSEQLIKMKEDGQGVCFDGPQNMKDAPVGDPNSSIPPPAKEVQRRLMSSQTSRHARSHTSAPCVFSEVDMPSAGEVHEANIKL